MALRKKRSARKVRKRRSVRRPASRSVRSPVHSVAYEQGRIEGFRQGKKAGFEHGRADAASALASQASSAALEPGYPFVDALVIVSGSIPSIEIGVLQPFNALRRCDQFQFDVKMENEVNREMIAAAKTVVFVRNVEPEAYKLLEWAHELGKKTVYVIDDNFLEIPPVNPVGIYYSDPARRETFINFLRNAQIVKVDALELGNYIRERFNKNVVYFPGSVDFEWLDQQERVDRNNNQVVIGYAGGEKERDFEPVVQALDRILAYYGGFVRLEFYGYAPASLADHPSVRHEGGNMEYRSFIQKLHRSNWDIGLAPLGDNAFNHCKTNNKYREYGACRIPGIYSESPVYSPWVAHGETGYLVPHTVEGWYEGLKEMIDHPPLRHHIKRNAEVAARGQFSLNACLDNWKTTIFERG